MPPRAFNATSTSLGLGYRALTRWPRCVRPTSAIHSLPETCTRALGFSACLVTCRLEPVVRPKGPSFHDALDPLRRAVRQRGRVVTGACLCRGFAPGKATWSRSVHDFVSDTPSPSGSRFRLCRTACVVARRIEIAFTAPREESGFPRPEMPSSASSAAFARRSSPTLSCDAVRLSATS